MSQNPQGGLLSGWTSKESQRLPGRYIGWQEQPRSLKRLKRKLTNMMPIIFVASVKHLKIN